MTAERKDGIEQSSGVIFLRGKGGEGIIALDKLRIDQSTFVQRLMVTGW